MGKQDILWGIAPIGWRNDDMPEIGAGNTLQHLLSDIVVAGFQGTEVGGFSLNPPSSIRSWLSGTCGLREMVQQLYHTRRY